MALEDPSPRRTFLGTVSRVLDFSVKIPLSLLVLLGTASYAVSVLWTGWPIYLVCADVAAILTPPFAPSAFRLVVVIVLVLCGLVTRQLGRSLARRLRSRFTRKHKIVGYSVALLVMVCSFAMYGPVKNALNELRYRGPSADSTIAFARRYHESGVETDAVIVTTEETPRPLFLQGGWVQPEESLWIRVTESQIEELRRRLRKRGYFSLPRYVAGPPRLSDRHFFGISFITQDKRREVIASLASQAWGLFDPSMSEFLASLHLPEDWRWSEEVPGRKDYRETQLAATAE